MPELSSSRITINRDSIGDTSLCQHRSIVKNDRPGTDSSLLLYVDNEITANGHDFDTFDDTAEDQYTTVLLNGGEELDGDAEFKSSSCEGETQAISYAGNCKDAPTEYDIKGDMSEDVDAPSITTQTDTDMLTMETYDGILPNKPTPECKRVNSAATRGPGPGRSSWQAPIRLVSEFGDRVADLLTIGRGLQHLRHLDEVQRFLNDPQLCPRGCGWIYPLLSQFKSHEKQTVVMLVLQCPKKHARLNPSNPEASCFTDLFVSALISYLKQNGIGCIAMDFRKECRRNVEDNHCPLLNDNEIITCGIATMAEVHVARNVFGIHIAATIAISASTCFAVECLERDSSFAQMLGKVYRIRWHPRAIPDLAMSGFPHEVQGLIAKEMIDRDYQPALSSIFRDLQRSPPGEIWEFMKFRIVCSPVSVYSNIFVPVVDIFEFARKLEMVHFHDISSFDMLNDRIEASKRLQNAIAYLGYTQRHRYRLGVKIVQELQRHHPGVGWFQDAFTSSPSSTDFGDTRLPTAKHPIGGSSIPLEYHYILTTTTRNSSRLCQWRCISSLSRPVLHLGILTSIVTMISITEISDSQWDAMHGELHLFTHADVYQALENTTLENTHDLLQNPAFRRFCVSMFEELFGLSFNENDGWNPVFDPQLHGICNLPCLFLTLLLQAWGKAFREIECVEYIADGEQCWIPRVFLHDQRVIDLDFHQIINVDDHPEFEATILYAEAVAYAIFHALAART
ncbi:hypothetical protein FACUT_13919 [Fusarium acutatum]|uniref:Uncharacterized protein n=1 Tax=Fusarium acutatum TaxID=78861 RepID=A0A8H4NDD8_9HYPO|nr:hypothetical protein FACUT_13919 [Fusarium acutatum]